MQLYNGKPCPFHPYRNGKRPPIKVIRSFCLECMGGSSKFVSECSTKDCFLYPYRMGTNPSRTGIGKRSKSGAKASSILAQKGGLSWGFSS